MATCQAHADRPVVDELSGDMRAFTCLDCSEACIGCNEMGYPDRCARDQDGDRECSKEYRRVKAFRAADAYERAHEIERGY